MAQSTGGLPTQFGLASLDRPRTRRTLLIFLVCLTLPLLCLAWKSYELDFRAFYVASLATANHLDPYADNSSRGGQFADSAPLAAEPKSSPGENSRWIYPPSALLFVAPLASLPYVSARLLFDAVSLASLVTALYFLTDRFGIANIWVVLAYISVPVLACVQRGQIDLLILFCLVVAWRLGRSPWAGVFLGIAISIKIFPAVLLLWLLLRRRFREAATAMAFVGAVGFIAMARFGPGMYVSFFHNLTVMHSISLYAAPVDLHRFGIPNIDSQWLALSQGLIGSYNNPLIFLGNLGIVAGFGLTVAAALWLSYRGVSYEAGFFAMVLVSQLGNTALWAMGLVMYIPICLVLIDRVKSLPMTLLLMVPLYLPSQVRIFNVNPRFVLAVLLTVWVIARKPDSPMQLYGDGPTANV